MTFSQNTQSLHTLGIIAIAALVTILLRFLPFLIFGKKKETPAYITYLGQVLPYAIMGMLVVYCLKGISFESPAGYLPTCIGVVGVVLLHLWKKNSLISILGGTILYMVLVQLPIFS